MGEYLIIKERYAHKLPNEWSYEEGALVEPFSVGYFGIWGNSGYVDASDIVIVFGAGPIGLSALIVAKTARAKVIIIEPFKSRRDLASKLSADEVIDPTTCNLKEEIFSLTDGLGGNVIVEASGNDKAISSVFDVAGHSARVRFIGHSVGRKVPVEIGLTIWKTLEITGSGGIKNFMPRTIRFMERIRNEFDFKSLISHRYPFKDIHTAFNKAVNDKKNAFKIMLKF
jgi:threonine dehydrogenase-like Zn-dependent dehydrogenase